MKTDTEKTGGGSTATNVIPEGIAVLGSHPDTVMMAPFNQGWKVYACSPHNFERRELPQMDEWFEVHPRIADATRAYPYLKFLETLPKVWLQDEEALPHIPGGVRYPTEEMEKRYLGARFFLQTSSIALILAKAIADCEEQGIKQIGIWGVMQATPNEYAYQRSGIQYFIAEAANRGIKVVAPDVSMLFEPPNHTF